MRWHALHPRVPCVLQLHFDDGRVYLAQMLASDPQSDIGLLKIVPHPASPLPAFPFLKPGRAAELDPGDVIHVLGAPLGGKLTVASGIYGNSMFIIDDPTIDTRYVLRGQDDWSLLQINATVMEGNSGGPVVNADGDVVGIVAMGKTSSHGVGSISYAVSMDQAWPIIQSLVTNGYAVRGRVGMSINLLQAPIAGASLPPGVQTAIVVTSVAPGHCPLR